MSTTSGEGARFGRTLRESNVPAADAVKERVDGPNVVMVVLDDLGFAQLGCFGSDIATPNIDGLAAGGLRYNRSTSPRCARRRAPRC